jgi:hypothetical protein
MVNKTNNHLSLNIKKTTAYDVGNPGLIKSPVLSSNDSLRTIVPLLDKAVIRTEGRKLY